MFIASKILVPDLVWQDLSKLFSNFEKQVVEREREGERD